MKATRMTLDDASPGRIVLVIASALLLVYWPFALLVCIANFAGGTWQGETLLRGITTTVLAAILPMIMSFLLLWLSFFRKQPESSGAVAHTGNILSRIILGLLGVLLVLTGIASLSLIMVLAITGKQAPDLFRVGFMILFVYVGLALLKKGVGDRFLREYKKCS